ncbi:glycosyl transferase [Clostridium acetobutylicum]|nr:glycosyl transferase [Clostridium acetobutylicum]
MLSIIIPVYNEKGNILELTSRIKSALKNNEYEIIFVDDSTDETPKIIESLALKYNNIRLKHRKGKKGLSSAVIDGFKFARGDVLSVMDGDLQHPPEMLKSMLFEMKKDTDIVICSRFVLGGKEEGLNIFRKVASFIARLIGKIFLKPLRKISDPTAGFFMLKRKVIKNRDLRAIGWKILIEILVMGDYKRVVELPYSFKRRKHEKSKFTISVQGQYLKQIVSLFIRSKKYNIK